jgi:hypothetical protein
MNSSFTNMSSNGAGAGLDAGGVQEFLNGQSVVSQTVLVIVLALILYIVMMIMESVYLLWAQAEGSRVDVFPYRQNAQNGQEIITQNPAISSAITLPPSYNERTGAEFTYSFFLLLNANGFSNTASTELKHVFHKGYSKMTPLMSPGVFVHGNKNTLRIYANSTKKIQNFVDIEDIPIGKWVHVVILARKNALEIYINGNIIKKMSVEGVLMQNYQDLILFSQRQGIRLGSGADEKQVNGPFNGDLASLTYFSYAISYSEIQGLVSAGPSTETKKGGAADVANPYLVDNWWTGAH